METLPQIRTIDQLIEILNAGPGYDGFIGIMKSLDLDFDELRQYCFWNKAHFTRNCIEKTDLYELLLICWEKGQKTSIHDYDAQEGWVYIVDGELMTEWYARDTMTKIAMEKVEAGSFTYINNYLGMHRFVNASDERTLSIHLYAEPVNEYYIYNEATGEIEKEPVRYDSIKGKPLEQSHPSR